ncbi:MAG: metallophosphoesterase [Bacteroidetes bacterium OLB11]|nr:MAG: metallophosphoesterase [Bacteroidetes bacterium OLB11]
MRKMPVFGLLLVILLLVILEYYTYTALRFLLRTSRPSFRTFFTTIYVAVSIIIILMFLFFPYLRTIEINKALKNFLFGFSFGFIIAKVLISLVLILDDLRRLFFYMISFLPNGEISPEKIEKGMTRSQFLNTIALLLGGGFFMTLLYGMSNRYNYKVKKIKLKFDNLPESFRGLKAVHISDIHSGSFNNIKAVKRGVDMVNSLNADVVFFYRRFSE